MQVRVVHYLCEWRYKRHEIERILAVSIDKHR